MKVYVCFLNYGYEGKSEPKAVYSSEALAKAWVLGNQQSSGTDGHYKVMNIDGEDE